MYAPLRAADNRRKKIALIGTAVYKLSHAQHFLDPVSYTHLRAHETVLELVCRLLLEKK